MNGKRKSVFKYSLIKPNFIKRVKINSGNVK